MPTQQLIALIIDHSVALVALALGLERGVFLAQPYLKGEWFHFSQQLLDFIDATPLLKLAAVVLGLVVLRSVYHLVSHYSQ